jgi:hypothetical protein
MHTVEQLGVLHSDLDVEMMELDERGVVRMPSWP